MLVVIFAMFVVYIFLLTVLQFVRVVPHPKRKRGSVVDGVFRVWGTDNDVVQKRKI
jgi:hypothetical protein